MKEHEYASILAALDAALEVFESHPARFGFELEAYERLRDLRERTAATLRRLRPTPDGASA